jgi:hypothetical protein
MQANPNPIINAISGSGCIPGLKNVAKKKVLHMHSCKCLARQINVDLSFGRVACKYSSWYYTRVITGFEDNQDLSIVKAAIVSLIMICELEDAKRNHTWDSYNIENL